MQIKHTKVSDENIKFVSERALRAEQVDELENHRSKPLDREALIKRIRFGKEIEKVEES